MYLRYFMLFIFVAVLPACVSKQKYMEAMSQVQNLTTEKDELISKVKSLEESVDKKEKEIKVALENAKALERGKAESDARIKELEKDVEARIKEINGLKKDMDDLRVEKDKEIEGLKFKIKGIQEQTEALLEQVKSALK